MREDVKFSFDKDSRRIDGSPDVQYIPNQDLKVVLLIRIKVTERWLTKGHSEITHDVLIHVMDRVVP